MKVIDTKTLWGTDREVRCPKDGFISLRALLEKDGMGFSLHETIVPQGPPQHWHYMEHKEACYCVHGHGELVNLSNGDRHEIRPGVVYVLDKNDDHTFEAFKDTVLISVFNPPITGSETHNENGSYERNKTYDYANGSVNDHWER